MLVRTENAIKTQYNGSKTNQEASRFASLPPPGSVPRTSPAAGQTTKTARRHAREGAATRTLSSASRCDFPMGVRVMALMMVVAEGVQGIVAVGVQLVVVAALGEVAGAAVVAGDSKVNATEVT